MYIEQLVLDNLRTFVRTTLDFLHPDQFADSLKRTSARSKVRKIPTPQLTNVNLLVGDNGSGKSTVLQAIALASLGPAAPEAQLPLRSLVRFREMTAKGKADSNRASIKARLRLHEQDGGEQTIRSSLDVVRRGELESLSFQGKGDDEWGPVFESQNEAFFCAAYGATRRIDAGESLERGSKPKSFFLRGQRMQSVFQDSFALYPLGWWLPELQATNPGRYSQVVSLMNALLEPAEYRFTGEMRNREYLFERGSIQVPLPSLSDGYRAFISWMADLLYHVCYGCPPGRKLTESSGIVMVDEIDLHLHPKWQMQVVQTVARALPRMQFIFTSHSPLVAGSLEWMNILTMKIDSSRNRTKVQRLEQSVHGLDADQVLLTGFFGLETTRAPSKVSELEELQRKARGGDRQAARQLIVAMSKGTEVAQ